MLDAPSMARLKQLMAKYNKSKRSTIDTRPISGMVGQPCEGYVQDENGKLIRIAYAENNEQIGPGSYDLINHEQKSKLPIKIQDSSHQTFKETTNRVPSPGKYMPSDINTRIPHLIPRGTVSRSSQPKHVVEGPTITHPSWLPKSSLIIDAKGNTKNFRLSHPNFDFRTQLSTFQFSSNTHRNIFPSKFLSPSPVLHAKQAPPIEFDPNSNSPAFADKTDRFKDKIQSTPSPTTYTISDSFGKAPTKILTSLPDEKDSLHKITGSCFDDYNSYVKVNDKNNPYQPAPDPTTYAGPVIQSVDTTHNSPQFMDKIERFKKISSDTPPPAFYNVNQNTAIIAPKHKIQNRSSLPSESWCNNYTSDNPPVGTYNPKFNKSLPKSGYISSIGRRDPKQKEDYPLAFRTTHSSLLKKSYNANYMNAEYNYS